MINLDVQQKERFRKLSTKIIFYLLLGIIYYIFVIVTDIKIPCIIKRITGKVCPGCGITRMIIELSRGNILMAAKYNIFLLILLPFAFGWGIYRFVTYVKHGNKKYSKSELVCLIIVYLLTVAFWIMRNTEKFAWLAPVD